MNHAATRFRITSARDIVLVGVCLEAVALPFSIAVSQWGIGLMFIGWLAASIKDRKLRLSLDTLTRPFLVYVGIFLLASAFSERAEHSLYAVWDNEWLAMSAAFIVWLAPDEEELRRILGLLIGSATIAALYGVIQHFTGWQLIGHRGLFLAYFFGEHAAWRPVGFFSHALSFGYDMAMIFFVAVGLAMFGEGPRRWIRVTAISLLSLVTIVSFSRSTWIAVIATGLVVAMVVPRSGGRRTLLAGLAVAIALMFITPQVRQRAEMLSATENPDRVVYWHIALEIFQDHPLLGIGADNWDLFYPRYRPAHTTARLETPDHPHNEYLNVLSSAGAPGLLAFLWLWGSFMVTTFRSYRRETNTGSKAIMLAGGSAVLCMLVGQMTQDIFHDFTNQLLWWFIVGIVLVVLRRQRLYDAPPDA